MKEESSWEPWRRPEISGDYDREGTRKDTTEEQKRWRCVQVRRDEAEVEGGFRVWVARVLLASVRYPRRRQIFRRDH